MQDQEDEGHHDQEVNEASGDMEHDITQEPSDYQNTKENQEHDFHSFVAKPDCRAARSYQRRGWTAGPGAAQSARELSLEDPPPDLGERRRMSQYLFEAKGVPNRESSGGSWMSSARGAHSIGSDRSTISVTMIRTVSPIMSRYSSVE
jgi:hypothetical protein